MLDAKVARFCGRLLIDLGSGCTWRQFSASCNGQALRLEGGAHGCACASATASAIFKLMA